MVRTNTESNDYTFSSWFERLSREEQMQVVAIKENESIENGLLGFT